MAQKGIGHLPWLCLGANGETRRPVLFSVLGFDIQTYGVSEALAALVAAVLLARAFERLSRKRDSAYSLVMWATIWGFVGAKIYYLLEQLPNFDLHHLGGMGFTWYGGLIGGVVAALVVVRRHPSEASALLTIRTPMGVGTRSMLRTETPEGGTSWR